MITGILLAAGESRRMGRDNKLLLPYKDKTLIQYVTTQLVNSDLDEVIVVTGYQDNFIREALNKLDVQFAHNPDYYSGQTSSIQAGVKKLSPLSKGFLVCLADMPLLQSMHYNAIIQKLKKEIANNPSIILRPVHKEKPGHPVAFSMLQKENVLSCKEAEGCKSILKEQSQDLMLWPIANEAYYRDVDTKMEYYKL